MIDRIIDVASGSAQGFWGVLLFFAIFMILTAIGITVLERRSERGDYFSQYLEIIKKNIQINNDTANNDEKKKDGKK